MVAAGGVLAPRSACIDVLAGGGGVVESECVGDDGGGDLEDKLAQGRDAAAGVLAGRGVSGPHQRRCNPECDIPREQMARSCEALSPDTQGGLQCFAFTPERC